MAASVLHGESSARTHDHLWYRILIAQFTDVLITSIMTVQAWGARVSNLGPAAREMHIEMAAGHVAQVQRRAVDRRRYHLYQWVSGGSLADWPGVHHILHSVRWVSQADCDPSRLTEGSATWIELCIPIMPAFHSLTVVSILLQPRFAHERSPVVMPAPLEIDTVRLGTGISWGFGQTSNIMAVEEGELPRSVDVAWRRRKSDQQPEAAAGRHLHVTVVDSSSDGTQPFTSGSHFRAPDPQP